MAFWQDLPEAVRDSVDILINPLLSIHQTGPLPSLDGVSGLIFTSANALNAYRALGGSRRDIPAIAVGEGTAAAARSLGFAVDVAGGNADRLVQHVLDCGYTGPLVHLRGDVSIGDVAKRLTSKGVPTTEAVLYEQRLEPFTQECREALSQDRPIIVPVFSPRTARQLGVESVGLGAFAYAAISQAVADALPFGDSARCRIARAPNRDGMVALVSEMISDAVKLERQSGDL